MRLASAQDMDPTAIDLLEVRDRVAEALGTEFLPGDPLDGKTAVRDSITGLLGCSELEAEQLVETMIGRGFMRYREDPHGEHPGAWQLAG